jgi:hypothetical protein
MMGGEGGGELLAHLSAVADGQHHLCDARLLQGLQANMAQQQVAGAGEDGGEGKDVKGREWVA